MESTSYELLKIETKIDSLEKELSTLFDDFRLAANNNVQDEKLRYDKLEKMSFCCLELLEKYREYTKKLKK
jgi:hypothetical protein|tara:strand:- start:269 stop:481 length:213 start_codon:yes stop_codon:yes gene_type:complete